MEEFEEFREKIINSDTSKFIETLPSKERQIERIKEWETQIIKEFKV